MSISGSVTSHSMDVMSIHLAGHVSVYRHHPIPRHFVLVAPYIHSSYRNAKGVYIVHLWNFMENECVLYYADVISPNNMDIRVYPFLYLPIDLVWEHGMGGFTIT